MIAGGIDLWRSTDGGNSLAEISTWWAHPPSPHADQHAIVAHPSYDGTSNRTMFFGSDGGIWSAPDIQAVGQEAAARTVAVAHERRQDTQHPYEWAELAVD